MTSAPATPTPPVMEYSEAITVPSEAELSAAEEAEFKKHHRLGLPTGDRLLLGAYAGGLGGFFLGAVEGGRKEGLRFRAENAHRLPTSQKGWYFYHKSKNYAAMYGGVKEGLRMGLRAGIWTVGFIYLEAAADHNRGYGGQQDFLSTTMAGVVTAALWSAWHRFPAATTVRTGKLGFKIGLTYGLAQDLLGYYRGRRIGYIEWLKKRLGSENEIEDEKSSIVGRALG